MAKTETLDAVVARALIKINREQEDYGAEHKIIPPTAINWIAPKIATTIYTSDWWDAVGADAKAGLYDDRDNEPDPNEVVVLGALLATLRGPAVASVAVEINYSAIVARFTFMKSPYRITVERITEGDRP